MKKQADGYYYEKIVTWRKKPDWLKLIGSLFGFAGVIIYTIIFNWSNLFTANASILMKIFTTLLILKAYCLLIVFSAKWLSDSEGHGKKVKFRRIGK